MDKRKGTDHDPKHTTSSVKHGGGSIMMCEFMAASETDFLVFINNVIADKYSRMKTEVFQAILSAHIQLNASEVFGQDFTMQMDNDSKQMRKQPNSF